MAIEHNPNNPHQAIISLTIDIMEQISNGMVTGLPIKRFGKLYTVIGNNQEECETKLNTFLEKLNNGTRNKTEGNERGDDSSEESE